MANPAHLEMVKKGTDALENWYKQHGPVGLDLSFTNLIEANLSRADLAQATVVGTSIGNCDLSQAQNLESVQHESPSSIAVDTLVATLRGAGGQFGYDQLLFLRSPASPGRCSITYLGWSKLTPCSSSLVS